MTWRRMGKWRYTSSILDLDTRWRWVASFTPLSLYLQRRSPHCPLDTRLGVPQSRSVHCGEEKITTIGSRIGTIQPIADRYTTDWEVLIYLLVIYLTSLTAVWTTQRRELISIEWVGKDMKGSGHDLIWSNIFAFTWKDKEICWKPDSPNRSTG
jgi:hypothetical protein